MLTKILRILLNETFVNLVTQPSNGYEKAWRIRIFDNGGDNYNLLRGCRIRHMGIGVHGTPKITHWKYAYSPTHKL